MADRRRFSAEFMAKVVLELLDGSKSLSQASREYGIKDSVLSRWKQEFVERSAMVFEPNGARDDRDQRITELERMVGVWRWNLRWQKKHLGVFVDDGEEAGIGERVSRSRKVSSRKAMSLAGAGAEQLLLPAGRTRRTRAAGSH